MQCEAALCLLCEKPVLFERSRYVDFGADALVCSRCWDLNDWETIQLVARLRRHIRELYERDGQRGEFLSRLWSYVWRLGQRVGLEDEQ